MSKKIWRVGTAYIPVKDVQTSADWYAGKLGAELNYIDEDKAILNLANQSFFLVKAAESQSANFTDASGTERFSLTFEVDGVDALEAVHQELSENGVHTGEIEERGHAGRNFVFRDPNGNLFDVWSELSPSFKEKFIVSQ
ncbi:VOC family protein [Bacillus sp. UMB0728]|uniref:VOC family protein n=1 Tax=Bacillus sp. UMB0728 TaxID=2066052 RepID=UPI000C77C6D5|nr:VOC family protein [Bacillus sp. UMB0728]PLR74800.1 VOC family protein [Bacillus sp. UMB0728]